MIKRILLLFIGIGCLLTVSSTNVQAEEQATYLKVLQLNIWHEGTMVKGGFEGLVETVTQVQPDLILMSEVRNYENVDFLEQLKSALKKKKLIFEGKTEWSVDVGILSRYPILAQDTVCGTDGGGLKAHIQINGKEIVAYSVHLDYTHYACYLPRGYNGETWKKINNPITDSSAIEQANRTSKRDEEMRNFLTDAANEKGKFLILGGDFNEPSHLDWQENTKNLWEHQGTVVRWDCSVLLSEAGFIDSFREKYPNPVTHPGFTYPANNPDVTLKDLDWVPEADGRDRIDFIYYYAPSEKFQLKEVKIIGPKGSISHNRRVKEESGENTVYTPQCTWPSDHRGILTTFHIK